MTYTVVFSPQSERDLINTYRYIALKGFPENAAKFAHSLTSFCLHLHTLPDRGISRDDLRPGLRILGFKDQANIAFAVNRDRRTVTILRILRRGQSVEKAFRKRP